MHPYNYHDATFVLLIWKLGNIKLDSIIGIFDQILDFISTTVSLSNSIDFHQIYEVLVMFLAQNSVNVQKIYSFNELGVL